MTTWTFVPAKRDVSASTAPGAVRVVVSASTALDVVDYSGDGTIEIGGERFNLEYENGEWILSHPQWSLVGCGATMPAARDDVIAEARELAEEMRNDNARSLSPQARRLRRFVLDLSHAYAARP